MKKILIIALSLIMVLSLVACSNNNTKDDNNTPNVEQNNETNDQNNTNNEDNTTDENNNATNEDLNITPENQALADLITANRDADFNEAYQIVASKDHEMAELFFSLMGISEDDLSEYAISLSPMNVKAYCVAIVKPADGKKDTILEALNSYKSSQEKSFEQYLPDQYEIAQNTVIKEVGDYIVFVMSENSTAIADNIEKGLNK